MKTSSIPSVEVTITSDLVCPWCWVGLKKLQIASKDANVSANITWKPFMLRPDTPVQGTPKGGSPASRVGTHLRQAGHSVGIDFTGLTDRTPNTLLFHVTMKMLQDSPDIDKKTSTAFHEAVFMGYFTLGVFPDQAGLLIAAKKTSDLVHEKVKNFYESESHTFAQLEREVMQECRQAQRLGVSGVPSFTFGDDKYPAFSGAQPTTVFSKELLKHATK